MPTITPLQGFVSGYAYKLSPEADTGTFQASLVEHDGLEYMAVEVTGTDVGVVVRLVVVDNHCYRRLEHFSRSGVPGRSGPAAERDFALIRDALRILRHGVEAQTTAHDSLRATRPKLLYTGDNIRFCDSIIEMMIDTYGLEPATSPDG